MGLAMASRSWPRVNSDVSGQPPSREAMAFLQASPKVRPIPITSPTLRIALPRVRSAALNFSKFQRGILTMT